MAANGNAFGYVKMVLPSEIEGLQNLFHSGKKYLCVDYESCEFEAVLTPSLMSALIHTIPWGFVLAQEALKNL